MATASTGRLVKDELYEQFARIGKAAAHPKRIELLDLLCQGERSVEVIADAAAMSVVNTSAHLRVLREARLVATRKDGTRVFYRLADDAVCEFFSALRDLAGDRYAEVDRIVRDFFEARDELDPVNRDELLRRAGEGDVIVLDVRPREEYESGHIPGAVSIPLADLKGRMPELRRDTEIVAYCRGSYCVLAPQALELLRKRGFTARRLEDGFPEWRRAGLPVATGREPSTDRHPTSTTEMTGP
ncbi:metalloregulator ArsR/SmtB family transcription factor [bacterium]|nr:metalloregulator ArsR/SmtB family transcription factor [bacterium]